MMSIPELVAIISAVLAFLGLIFTGCQICLSRRTLSLHLFERVFLEIKSLEEKIGSMASKGDKSELDLWNSQFFNTLEFFAFMVNQKYLADQKLVGFFRPAFIDWYKRIFLKTDRYAQDQNAFPEMRALYSTLTTSKKPSLWKMVSRWLERTICKSG